MSENKDEAVNNPINTFSQFSKHFLEIRWRRGIKHEGVLEKAIKVLKTTVHKATKQGVVLNYHEDDLLESLEEILTEIKRNNQILDKQLTQAEHDEEIKKMCNEDITHKNQ